MANDSVLKKVRNLMALADAAGTEAESLAAASAAAKLIAKHRIDMAEVREKDTFSLQESAVPGFMQVRIASWERDLWAGVCRPLGCLPVVRKEWFRGKGVYTLCALGQECDAAVEMFQLLRTTIRLMMKRHLGKGRSWLQSYARGLTHRAVATFADSFLSELEGCKALVPVVPPMPEGVRKSRHTPAPRDPDGYVRGILDAGNAGLGDRKKKLEGVTP